MSPDRKTFDYSQNGRRDHDTYSAINSINRNLAKGGFILGGLVVGGYFLFKKVNDLARDVKKMKEEMGK